MALSISVAFAQATCLSSKAPDLNVLAIIVVLEKELDLADL